MTLTATTPVGRIGVAEYLAREEVSEERHEYHDGEILAMSGGTFKHSQVAINLTSLLHRRLRGTPCQAVVSNMRVGIRPNAFMGRRFFYPDASVVCGPVVFDPDDPKQTTLFNPRVVFEVLSPSTEAHDRGEKFRHYQLMPTLEEYVLLARDRARVEGLLRQPDGTWNLATWDAATDGPEAAAKVRCVGLDLPLTDLYARVDLPDAAP